VHTGIDIDAPTGTPVRASAPGRVLWAGYGVYAGKYDSKDPYGLAVTLQHDFGFKGEKLYSIYAHMNEIYVQPNQMVNTGDILGIVGETGATTGPHLHFEVRWKQNMFNSTLNPELWLAPPQGWGVLAGRVMNTSGSFYTSQDVTVMRQIKNRPGLYAHTVTNMCAAIRIIRKTWFSVIFPRVTILSKLNMRILHTGTTFPLQPVPFLTSSLKVKKDLPLVCPKR
jgi:murein DD-endopeptidase MepM/ murein hydrolase activator NlpD